MDDLWPDRDPAGHLLRPVASADVTSHTADLTHWVLTLSCPDRPGIVRAVAGLLADHGGNITESQQFGDPLSGLFFMRVQVEAPTGRGSSPRPSSRWPTSSR